jgi:hypothetical protein
MKEVKMLTDIAGRFDEGEGVYPHGVKRGDIVKVSDVAAQRYLNAGMAQLDLKAPPGPAFRTPMWG